MYLTDEILDKLNTTGKTKNSSLKAGTPERITLPDIMVRSFAEVKELAGDTLSWGEKNFLYQQAQKELKENKMAESRILSRANPQLANAVRLGIRQSSMLGGYDDLFPQRASSFVKPGSVASMFSPAGYLTELYREARGLHPSTSQYHLDTRRPDLASLSLSQSNMDDELSTLSLSNELLLNNIQSQESLDYDGTLEMLSTYRQTGATPYNQPYEAVRQSIILQDPDFTAFRNNPAVAAEMNTASLLGIQADISPELHKILTEEITEAKADELIKENFGDIAPSAFQSIDYLARWYGVSYDEMSLLVSLVSTADNTTPGVQYYQNDQLISLVASDGKLGAVLIKRTLTYDSNDSVNYVELIPQGNGKYILNFKLHNTYESTPVFMVGTEGSGTGDVYKDDSFVPEGEKAYSIAITLDEDKLSAGLTLSIGRWSLPGEGGGRTSDIYFKADTYSFSVFLLKLNKVIRLYKASGIAPSDIRTVIESSNNDLTITENVLSQLFWVHYYMQTYGIDVSAALVLTGAVISQINHSNTLSAFTRLFNSPPLNNQLFSADGTALSLKPGASDDTFRLGVLKRALQVNDTELYTLWGLTGTKFTATIDKLSALYRTRLLAEIHGLSVTELGMLLSVSPYAGKKLGSLKDTALSGLISFIAQYTQWLKDQNWPVSDLYLMLTGRFSTTLTPDIENLIASLKNGLASQDLNQASEAELITAAAPFIAAATQLESAGTAEAILQWIDQLKPQNLTVAGFLTLADKDSRTAAETASLVAWCQVVGQLALIARSIGLNEAELSFVVTHPNQILRDAKVLPRDIGTLYELTALHNMLSRCGVHASEIITALAKGRLEVSSLATVLTLDEQALAQALQRVSSYEYFYNWPGVSGALQWLNVATSLHISPANVKALTELTSESPYADWVAASHALQAGLNLQQTAQLQATLDEATSSAVSTYVIKNGSPSWVTNRDELYSWLLIDNQVSAQIKTTRIAEAIASVQLYVNRALSGQEGSVDNAVKSRQFFSADWDTYNKRYSTWAGVSELVYYPENYVDPTLRIGQTSMMDEMLQTLSQSQLTSDTVEDAFKTYMTRFEEIANLDVISGYHDSVSDKNGTTYLIGRSAIGDYYWRSAEIDKMSDGKLPANAWSEWKKITAALTPVNKLVRPVIFQSRLYLVWVESREISTADGNTTTKKNEFLLKYTHILHDGTWSVPFSTSLSDDKFTLSIGTNTGFYCASDADGASAEQLYVIFYEKSTVYDAAPDAIKSLSIQPDNSAEELTDKITKAIFGDVYLQLDTRSNVRLNTPYVGSKVVVNSIESSGYTWGDSNFTTISNSEILNYSIDKAEKELTFDINAKIIFGFKDNSRNKNLIDLMKAVSAGSMEGLYYIPAEKQIRESDANLADEIVCLKDGGNYTFHGNFDYLFPEKIRVVNFDDGVHDLSSNKFTYKNVGASVEIGTANIYRNVLIGYSLLWDFSGFLPLDITNPLNNFVIKSNADISITKPKSRTTSVYSFDNAVFNLKSSKLQIPVDRFSNGQLLLDITVQGYSDAEQDQSLGSQTFTLDLLKGGTLPVITLNRTDTYAQYLQYGAHRIRVNTLFARKLVARANAGLNTVLSMETQLLQEPKPGTGNYINITFKKYDKDLHGDGWFNLYFIGTEPDEVDAGKTVRSKYLYTTGNVSSTGETNLSLFLPLNPNKGGGEPNSVYIGVQYSDVDLTDSDLHMQFFKYDPATGTYKNHNNTTRGLASSVQNSPTEPMDFNGANALYFWEMFYYVPMMVFKRLLSESRFTEATQWIKYIWNPDGYLIKDQPATYRWNVRPLEEETTWHFNPLDSVDPDAVAQADPLHYKVATFMGYLDLLIARGDQAYRQLERDTLNEAKMWYVQALDILGDELYLSQSTGWTSPRLTDAADETTRKNGQQAMLTVRQQADAGELRTANSLTALFLPQQNEKLAGYWQTLNQRLYNLRHNLSIDGNPLSLSVYATPADPAALLSAAVNASSGGVDLPAAVMPLYRFPVILDSARSLVNQLTQFGSTLLSITERQDGEALSELLQTQGSALVLQSITLQDKEIAALDADRAALEESRSGAQSRLDSYTTLYDEDLSTGEKQAIGLFFLSSVIADGGRSFHTAAGGVDLLPNIFGLADGGSRWGAAFSALGSIADLSASATRTDGERISQSEAYRRRRQEWEIQRNSAQSDVKQINAQLASLAVRREAAVLQKTYLETQQSQTQAQMAFLQNKFSNKALYNWLRGKLSAIYYQFYDLTVSRCLMAQESYKWSLGTDAANFIRPGAWQGTYAGLMAGETLMLNLAQMEQSYLQKDEREKEVTRTVCLSEFYAGLEGDAAFTMADKVVALVTNGSGSAGNGDNTLSLTNKALLASLKLSDLNIGTDYPASLGKTRRIKQVSVTLPALVGPYQDVRAVLSYGGSVILPQGCQATAVSHGMNDSGQFQLDFSDSRWLPFEGIPIDDAGTLTLSFPQADSKQKDLLLSLTDIIMHIRYTIVS